MGRQQAHPRLHDKGSHDIDTGCILHTCYQLVSQIFCDEFDIKRCRRHRLDTPDPEIRHVLQPSALSGLQAAPTLRHVRWPTPE
ncbi:hypothetical protein D3C78_1527530 [compost metagenome]